MLHRAADALRLVVAGVLLVGGPNMGLGQDAPNVFLLAAAAYLALGVVLAVWTPLKQLHRQTRYVLAATTDVTALTLMMYASGGFASGLAVFLLLTVATLALEADRRLAAFAAALAATALLGENLWRLWLGHKAADPFFVGLTGGGAFAAALGAQWLGERLRRSQQALAQQQALTRWQAQLNDRIAKALGDGVLWVDADGVVRYASAQAVQLLGGDPTGQPVTQAVAGEIAPGQERWCRGTGTVLRLRASTAEADGSWLLILTDFAAAEREFQQRRLAALGMVVAGVAHELRNPLAGIAQALDLLRDAESVEERGEWLAVAERNIARISALVEDVLVLGRRKAPQPQAIALATWWPRFVAEFSERDRQRIEAHIEADAIAWADPENFRAAIDNVLSNALAFASQRPGAIRVEAFVPAASAQVIVRIRDDGPGVAPEIEAHLFSPFVSKRPGGTGLGLYLVQQLAQANGGAVRYWRGEPAGAVFELAWPLAMVPEQEAPRGRDHSD